MRRLIIVLGVLIGCDSEEPPAPAPVQQVAKADTGAADEEAKKDKGPPKPPRSTSEKAWDLFVAGDTAGALKAAESLIATDAADGWRLIEAAAAASEAPASVTLPDGASPLLRGRLALVAGDAKAAFDVAKSALGDGTDGDAVALLVEAVRAGAEAGDTEGWPASAKTLHAWATSPDARRARAHAEGARAVPGWRAALLRASVARSWGDHGVAMDELATVAGIDDPVARLAGNIGRYDLVVGDGFKGVDNSTLAEWADAAHAAGLLVGNTSVIGRVAQAAHDAHLRISDVPGALAMDRKALVRLEAPDGVDTSGAALLTAQAALYAGELVEAKERAASVLGADTNPESAGAQMAHFIGGMAAWELADADTLRRSAEGARGAHKDVLKALGAMQRGDMETARLQFPLDGLNPDDAAMVFPYAAQADKAGATKWLDRAVNASDRSGILSTRISSRLAKESHLRQVSKRSATALRKELLRLAPAGKAGDALRAELSVRNVLAGEQSPVIAGEGLPPVLAAWNSLSQRAKPASMKNKDWVAIVQWGRGRAAAARGDLEGHDAHFQVALGAMPLHRSGRLDPGTAIDASEGVDIDTDLALLGALKGEEAASMALSAHDVGHRMDTLALNLTLGLQPFSGLDEEARTGLLLAAARLRAQVRAWHAGTGDFPAEGFAALKAAETKAGETDSFAALLPVRGASASSLLSGFGRGAIVSYRASHGRLQGVALSRVGTAVRDLGDAKEIFAIAAQYREAMSVAAADKKTKTDHSSGHALREKVMDPFIGDLTGVGRYAIVGPPELLGFLFTTFPEQAEGLRWLADIRQMSVAPTIRALTREPREVDGETFKLDYLAFGPDDAPASDDEMTDFETPDELTVCGRYFQSGFNQILVGGDAKAETWKAKAAGARYIHIADVAPAMHGGFKMADGELSLNDVRNTPLHAELVLITARTTPEQQLHRARAFLDAGARWVLVSTWPVPDKTRVKFLANIYDSMAQERPPIRALSEGRQALFRDSLTGVDLDDPSIWGGLTLFGKP